VTLDGLGPVLGDRGGGHQIGRQALRLAVRAIQCPHHETMLAQMIPRALGVRPPTIPRLIQFSLRPMDRSVLAALAQVVDEAARAGDATAVRLLKQAAGDLAETLRDLVEMHDLANQPYRLVGTGSVATQSEIYWREFCRRARQFAPRLEPFRSPLPPVAGVALCGLPAASASRLRATLAEILKP
jgi:N-acetylglucosamine kinase-like BadF-type ATPase